MNWLDILLLVILAWSIASSFRKGLTREVIGLASVVLALMLGVWFYGTVGGMLAPYLSSRSLANLAGFLIVFCATLVAGAVVSTTIGKFWKVTGLSIVDHALGAGFGAVRGTLIAVALIMGIMAFSPNGKPPVSVVHSRLAPYVAKAAGVVSSVAPYEIKEGFRKTYAEGKAAWGKVLEDGLKNAPNAHKEKDERKL